MHICRHALGREMKRRLGKALLLFAITAIFVSSIVIVSSRRMVPSVAGSKGEQADQQSSHVQFDDRFKSDDTSASKNPFFERKPRSQIEAERRTRQTNSPAESPNWFKKEPPLATAVTNVFTVGRRTAKIVSKRTINEDAVYQFLTVQAEMDKITDSRLAELRVAAAQFKLGMLTNEVIRILGGGPTRQSQLNNHDFLAYSTHPTKISAGPGERFLVLHIEFDADGKLVSWKFRRD